MLIRIAELFARRAGMVVLAITLLTGLVATLGGWSASVDQAVEEARHSSFPKIPSGQTVIVAIDGRSLSHFGSWPWPRSVHGRLVDRLREAGARQIVFDIGFASPAADPAQDLAFAAAIERARGRVVLPALLENADGEFGPRDEALPPPSLGRHARIGAIWIRLDDDLFARNVPMSVEIGGARRPSLATFLSDRDNLPQDMNVPIDWSIEPGEIPLISYSDVLAGRVPAGFFEGRNVLIGPPRPRSATVS
jgi:CHASE2 domain-containing sensor protein